MITVIRDQSLADRLIAQRRAWGSDRHDEVWEGVYMMSPLAGNEHQRIVTRLTAILVEVIEAPGLGQVFAGANVTDRAEGWEKNFRCPDAAVFLNGGKAEDRGPFWLGGPDLAVEVVSPDDQSYEKLPFYESVDTRELLIIDRNPWAVVLYRLTDGKLIEAGRSTIGNGADVAGQVVTLAYRLLPGQKRPQIEVTHAPSGRCWVI